MDEREYQEALEEYKRDGRLFGDPPPTTAPPGEEDPEVEVYVELRVLMWLFAAAFLAALAWHVLTGIRTPEPYLVLVIVFMVSYMVVSRFWGFGRKRYSTSGKKTR